MQSPGEQQWRPQQQQQAEMRTLWVGDLRPWMDEKYLASIFGSSGEVVSTKIIRNKTSGLPEGYGFVEFATHACAEMMLQALAGTQMPHSEHMFRLNWAGPGLGERKADWGPDNSIFVGDLAPEVTDAILQETFRSRYSSVSGAKVALHSVTGKSRGFGFVRFGDEAERLRAMVEMNGVFCSTRPMRINAATSRRFVMPPQQQQQNQVVTNPAWVQSSSLNTDPNNTTVFIGGIEPGVSEDELREIFCGFGQIVYVNIIPNNCCAFVRFTHRPSAEEAIRRLQGTTIRGKPIKVSWGRRNPNKQVRNPVASFASNQNGYQGGSLVEVCPKLEFPSLDDLDPLAPLDIEAMNAAYISTREPFLVGRHLSLLRMCKKV